MAIADIENKTQKTVTVIADTLNPQISNILDKAIINMILDSKDGELRILEKAIFESDKPIEQLDVDDSLVLKLVYQRKR